MCNCVFEYHKTANGAFGAPSLHAVLAYCVWVTVQRRQTTIGIKVHNVGRRDGFDAKQRWHGAASKHTTELV